MNTNLPKISSYGNYSSDNYGLNTRQLNIAGVTLFYSYETIVAYRDDSDGLVVSQNQWSTTTGKHLNWIDGGNKQSRKDGETFNKMLQDMLNRHGLNS